MKTFNKISAIIWCLICIGAIIVALVAKKWEYALIASVTLGLAYVAWEEYREQKEREELYTKFRKKTKENDLGN